MAQNHEALRRARMGRPRKRGPRHPSGKLKQPPPSQAEVQQRLPTLWRRIKDHGIALGIDENVGTELGRLNLAGVISDAECAAGLNYAQIVGRYERLNGMPRRVPQSPPYELGRAGSSQGAPVEEQSFTEARVSPAYAQGYDPSLHQNSVAEAVRKQRRAKRRYDKAVSLIPTTEARAIVEEVCVHDRPIHSRHHDDLKRLLRRLAQHWGFER